MSETLAFDHEWRLPEWLPFGDDTIVPLAAGEPIAWQRVAST